MVKKKYSFILTGLNIPELHKQYGLGEINNITPIYHQIGQTETTNQLSIRRSKNVSMINYLTKQNIETYTNLNCFWCRHPFQSYAIGCPISIHFQNEIKDSKSPFSDNIDTIHVYSDQYHYEIDGVFCSFNCCKAYIEDNECDPFYSSSLSLLYKLYEDFNNKGEIHTAPSWRLLREYGGELTIEEFRENARMMTYEFREHARLIEYQSIGWVYDNNYAL